MTYHPHHTARIRSSSACLRLTLFSNAKQTLYPLPGTGQLPWVLSITVSSPSSSPWISPSVWKIRLASEFDKLRARSEPILCPRFPVWVRPANVSSFPEESRAISSSCLKMAEVVLRLCFSPIEAFFQNGLCPQSLARCPSISHWVSHPSPVRLMSSHHLLTELRLPPSRTGRLDTPRTVRAGRRLHQTSGPLEQSLIVGLGEAFPPPLSVEFILPFFAFPSSSSIILRNLLRREEVGSVHSGNRSGLQPALLPPEVQRALRRPFFYSLCLFFFFPHVRSS